MGLPGGGPSGCSTTTKGGRVDERLSRVHHSSAGRRPASGQHQAASRIPLRPHLEYLKGATHCRKAHRLHRACRHLQRAWRQRARQRRHPHLANEERHGEGTTGGGLVQAGRARRSACTPASPRRRRACRAATCHAHYCPLSRTLQPTCTVSVGPRVATTVIREMQRVRLRGGRLPGGSATGRGGGPAPSPGGA